MTKEVIFDGDDESCSVFQEMIKRDNSSGEGLRERIDTVAVAGNLLGYKMLQLVHKQDTKNYEELLGREQDLQKIREMAESSTFNSSHKSPSEEIKELRPSEATTNDGYKDNSFEIISKDPIHNIPIEESKEEALQLARKYVKNAFLECEPCEGYLEKKSPALFIKWQVGTIMSLKYYFIDQIFRNEEYAALLL